MVCSTQLQRAPLEAGRLETARNGRLGADQNLARARKS
jgi:hypothetical protein